MVEFGFELQGGWLVGVVVVEVHLQTEGAALPDGIESAVDDCLPLVEVVLVWHCVDALVVALLDLLVLLDQFALGVGGHY